MIVQILRNAMAALTPEGNLSGLVSAAYMSTGFVKSHLQ